MGILVIPLSISAIVVAFIEPTWAWFMIGIGVLLLLISLAGVKGQKWKDIPALSAEANKMYKRYGHFYTMSHGAAFYSYSTSILQLASIIIAVIGIFSAAWWGILFAIIVWFSLMPVARAFNPTNFIRDPYQRMVHNEIVEYMQMKRKESINEMLTKEVHTDEGSEHENV